MRTYYYFTPVNIAKHMVNSRNKIENIPKKVLVDIVGEQGKKREVVNYVMDNWLSLSNLQREKIFLHTLKKSFAPRNNTPLLGRWGHQQTQSGGNYPW